MIKLLNAKLTLFAGNTNVTTDSGLSLEMKTFYDKNLIKNAEPELVHERWAQKRPIPKNGGKTIEFRKFAPLTKQLTPLSEGVTPNGQKLSVTNKTATIAQYGGYVEMSDVLEMTTIDPILVEATALLGSQGGRTRDTVIREVLAGCTNHLYANGVAGRASLAQGTDALDVEDVRKAVRALDIQNAKKIDGYYVGIIHPDCKYDLMSDPAWLAPHQYQDTKNIYANEIGMIAGVRFVETTEAKIWNAAGAGSPKANVYGTLIFGSNAYGVTEIEGLGMQHIIKQKGSAGTADPLDQRSTAGWKCALAAEVLVDEYMVCIESTSSFATTANNWSN